MQCSYILDVLSADVMAPLLQTGRDPWELWASS